MKWIVMLQNENDELRGHKRKLEDYITEKRCKKAKIEQKLMKETVAKSKEITGKFHKKSKLRTSQEINKSKKR